MSPPVVRQRISLYVERVLRLTQPIVAERTFGQPARQVRHTAEAALAHYRTACLAKTPAVRQGSLRATVDALEESVFWLQLLRLMSVPAGRQVDEAIAVGTEIAALLDCAGALRVAR